jgi:hypothetical protein
MIKAKERNTIFNSHDAKNPRLKAEREIHQIQYILYLKYQYLQINLYLVELL